LRAEAALKRFEKTKEEEEEGSETDSEEEDVEEIVEFVLFLSGLIVVRSQRMKMRRL
jgi:hypothetical protein